MCFENIKDMNIILKNSIVSSCSSFVGNNLM